MVSSTASASPMLPRDQVKTFRSWMITIVEDQISRGANPRWNHRDCAGLVRFAIAEAFARHDEKWRKANGFLGRPLPAEIELATDEREKFKVFTASADGEKSQFARALPLIQNNANFLGKTPEKIEPGDLLFFDQGDDQHLMVWTGQRIVYHTGHRPVPNERSTDNGLRAVGLRQLMSWPDSRWQPRAENPNFIGYYRLAFLNSSPSERGTP
ncbi:MAG: DUF1175 family protein [Bdellovibrionota bacterium]